MKLLFVIKYKSGVMGKLFSKNICVGTLNFAGVTFSPFEFYSGNEEDKQELQDLSRIFKQLFLDELKDWKDQKGKQMTKNFQETFSKFYVADTIIKKQDAEKMVKAFKELEAADQVKLLQTFDWGIKNIQKNMHKQRYTPIYREGVGVLHGRLINREQFESQWHLQFEKNKNFVKFDKKLNKKEENRCLIYDYLLYKTIVQYIYNIKLQQKKNVLTFVKDFTKIQHGDRNWSGLDEANEVIEEYTTFLEKYFEKGYLKHSAKLEAVKNILETNDVLFIQDVDPDFELLNSLRDQGLINVIAPSKTAILIKKDKFQNLYNQLLIFDKAKQYNKDLCLNQFDYQDGNSTPAICFVDNYLFINVHFHSVNSTTIENLQEDAFVKLMRHLNKISNSYPSLNIIAGGDFCREITPTMKLGEHLKKKKNNKIQSDIQSDQGERDNFFKRFQCFPILPENNQSMYTTFKKRTWLQSQWNKSDDVNKECRSFIITNMKVENVNIEPKERLGEKLLTQEHPFQNCIVSVTLSKSSS